MFLVINVVWRIVDVLFFIVVVVVAAAVAAAAAAAAAHDSLSNDEMEWCSLSRGLGVFNHDEWKSSSLFFRTEALPIPVDRLSYSLLHLCPLLSLFLASLLVFRNFPSQHKLCLPATHRSFVWHPSQHSWQPEQQTMRIRNDYFTFWCFGRYITFFLHLLTRLFHDVQTFVLCCFSHLRALAAEICGVERGPCAGPCLDFLGSGPRAVCKQPRPHPHRISLDQRAFDTRCPVQLGSRPLPGLLRVTASVGWLGAPARRCYALKFQAGVRRASVETRGRGSSKLPRPLPGVRCLQR